MGTTRMPNQAVPAGNRVGPAANGRSRGVGAGMGDNHYLWLLVLLEVAALAFLRHGFKRYHGG